MNFFQTQLIVYQFFLCFGIVTSKWMSLIMISLNSTYFRPVLEFLHCIWLSLSIENNNIPLFILDRRLSRCLMKWTRIRKECWESPRYLSSISSSSSCCRDLGQMVRVKTRCMLWRDKSCGNGVSFGLFSCGNFRLFKKWLSVYMVEPNFDKFEFEFILKILVFEL